MSESFDSQLSVEGAGEEQSDNLLVIGFRRPLNGFPFNFGARWGQRLSCDSKSAQSNVSLTNMMRVFG